MESLRIDFRPLRPDWNPTNPELIRQCEDLRRGPEVLYRKLLFPELRNSYEDLLAAAGQVDLMVAGELVYAAPLVAEKLRLRWVSAILSPFSFFSSHDPSVMVNAPSLIRLRKFGPAAYRMGLNIGRLVTRHWSNPVRDLRRAQGLRAECDPVFRDKAARVQRLGGLHVSRNAYTVETAAAALMKLLDGVGFAKRAAEVGAQVAAENGLTTACSAIEAIL